MPREPQTTAKLSPHDVSALFKTCVLCSADLFQCERVVRGIRVPGRYCGMCAPNNGVEVDPITLLTEEQDYNDWLASFPMPLPQGGPDHHIRWTKHGFWSRSVQCRLPAGANAHYWVRYGIRSEMASYYWEKPIPLWVTSYYKRGLLGPAFVSSTQELFDFVVAPLRLAALPQWFAR